MKTLALLLLAFFVRHAEAGRPLKVVTSTTDLAWAVRELGGDKVEAIPLLKGTENPHYVDTIPDFIRRVADADVVCVVGLELEVGWMPKVLARSGNAKVQPGGTGYCELGRAITPLEKPTGPVDRSMGDVHPLGNPHFWLSPKAFAEAGKEIRDVLARVDAVNAEFFRKNYGLWVRRLTDFHLSQKKILEPLLKTEAASLALEYHREFAYFFAAYGLKSLGSIEEKPGFAPSAGRLAEVALLAKAKGVRVVLAGEYAPRNTLHRFEELSQVSVSRVPTSLQPQGRVKDYFALQAFLVETVRKTLQKAP